MRAPEEIQAEIDDLERKLKKREGKPGFATNSEAIKARLAECRAELPMRRLTSASSSRSMSAR
jgi:hypothetical protein